MDCPMYCPENSGYLGSEKNQATSGMTWYKMVTSPRKTTSEIKVKRR